MFFDVQSRRPPAVILTVSMFGLAIRGCWFLMLTSTLTMELVPLSAGFEAQFSPLIFHSYQAAKLAAFFILGFLAPLAWWRYKSLGIGVLFAIATTAVVEIGQAFIPGHRASAIELAVKLALLFTGFAAALDIRKYQDLTVGPLCVRFTSRYWSGPASIS
jgi:hypothetical protein